MSLPWFKMYADFSYCPRVQGMSEALQRRLLMLFCLRCREELHRITDDEICRALFISKKQWQHTKATFVKKGFIDESLTILKWEARQHGASKRESVEAGESEENRPKTSTERVRAYREKKRPPTLDETHETLDVTLDETHETLDVTLDETHETLDVTLDETQNVSHVTNDSTKTKAKSTACARSRARVDLDLDLDKEEDIDLDLKKSTRKNFGGNTEQTQSLRDAAHPAVSATPPAAAPLRGSLFAHVSQSQPSNLEPEIERPTPLTADQAPKHSGVDEQEKQVWQGENENRTIIVHE